MDQNKTIINVFKFFKTEKELGENFFPVYQPYRRAASACGLSRNVIMKIKEGASIAELSSLTPKRSPSTNLRFKKLRKLKRKKIRKVTLTCFELCKLRNIIDSLYLAKQKQPSIEKLKAAAQKEICYSSDSSTLKRIVKDDLGYTFVKRKMRPLLVLRPEVAACRARYLRRMMQNDELGAERKPVTFLEDTWICSRTSGTNTGSKRWFFINAGGEKGFISPARIVQRSRSTTGNYHREINIPEFMCWLKEQVLPALPAGGIVVIGHALHRATLIDYPAPALSAPTEHTKKWLRDHNIPFEENMTKFELYHLVSTVKTPKVFALDELLTTHGHEVLILPPFNWDLSPMQYIWAQLKEQMATQEAIDCYNIDTVEAATIAIRNVTASDWQCEIKRVRRLIPEYWERDQLVQAQQSALMALGGECSWDNENSSGGESSSGQESPLTEDEYIHVMPRGVGDGMEAKVIEIYSSDSDKD